MTATVRKSIDVIVFNNGNNDGTFSAAIAYNYLKEAKKQPKLVPVRPGIFNIRKFYNELKDKVILIVDLSFSAEEYEEIKKQAQVKTLISIDDHENTYDSNTVFIGNGTFSACVYTWKTFYPTKKVPLMVKYAGEGDNQKYPDFLPLTKVVLTPLNYRYTRSPYKKREQWISGEILEEIWEIITNQNNKLWIVIGKYMNEVQENIKEQIAKNAQIRNFQGYKVGVLNYNDPVLTKRIGRQIISNMQNRGQHIDFAVMWGWEYTSNAYKIQINDDHKQTKINMGRMAQVLAKIGGHHKGGHGKPHTGNFYWPHTHDKDIWDLFSKNYLTPKDRDYIEGKRRNF